MEGTAMRCPRCGHVQAPLMLCESCREAEFDPSEHPREPAGSEDGGEFTHKGGASVGAGSSSPKAWVHGEEPKMSRAEFTALPGNDSYAVGQSVLVWGSFGPIRGVVEEIDSGDPELISYTVTHPQNSKSGAGTYISNKSARLIRPFPG